MKVQQMIFVWIVLCNSCFLQMMCYPGSSAFYLNTVVFLFFFFNLFFIFICYIILNIPFVGGYFS
jgi:hypothetical protein